MRLLRAFALKFLSVTIMKNIILLHFALIFVVSFSNIANSAEMHPKQGATFKNTYVWDGRELKPKQGATFKNTWTFNGKEWKPKQGATFKNTWVVSGEIPIPVMVIVIYCNQSARN